MLIGKLRVLKLTFSTLLQSYKKSVLASVGVAIGTLSVLLINMFSNYTITIFNSEMTKLGIDGVVISLYASGQSVESEYYKNIKKLYCIDSVTPYLENKDCEINEIDDITISGVTNDFLNIYGLKLKYGSNFDDVNGEICIINSELAYDLFGLNNAVGRHVNTDINGMNITLEVVGVTEEDDVIASKITDAAASKNVYIPYSTLARYDGISEIGQLVLTIKDGLSESNSLLAIENLTIASLGEDNFEIQNLALQKNRILNLLQIVKNCLFIIGGISILVSVTSVFNIMLMKVNERKREIGIKKAIGATNITIILDFLCESSIIFISGCLIGIVLYSVCFFILKATMGNAFSFNIPLCVTTVVVGLLLGVISGVYPSYKAAKLKPVDTIYHN